MLCSQLHFLDNLAKRFHKDECKYYERKCLCYKYMHHKNITKNTIKTIISRKVGLELF